MIEAIDLEKALRDIYGQPIVRPPNTFGASEGGFCKQKLVLKSRLKRETKVNGKMVIGKIFHKELKEIVKNTIYGKAHGLKFWKAPEFESLATYHDPRGFSIEGHVDCDLPAVDAIIELKTTDYRQEYSDGDEILRAYLLQANAYACIKKRKRFELWFVYKQFRDIMNERFVSVISADADMELFNEFLDNCYLVWRAIKEGKDLMGPEASWECKYCSYVDDCVHWKEILGQFARMVPSTKANLTGSPDMARAFKLQSDRGLLKYRRDIKQYVWKTAEDEDVVENVEKD